MLGNRSDRRVGGRDWIRTSVHLRGQIYSLLPLTTRPPFHERRCQSEGAQCPRIADLSTPVSRCRNNLRDGCARCA
ncbi:hypothetical protein SPHINGO8AM_130144 [Sphingomonas sp. 8AM]|nr:hypothetical protein SPHINGO8AM_130144 [Sphingomonas sp. 8AM]